MYTKDDNKFLQPKVWLSTPTMHGKELSYIEDAYASNWMSTVGENINQVESTLCKKIGCRYSVALSSGTAALHMAIRAAGYEVYGNPGVGKGVLDGKYVFCSDMTFAATVNPVLYEGGIPIFIDIEQETWNMDPVALEQAFDLYPEVKVVVVAHLYGVPAKLEELQLICQKHNAILIEDAAESLGATYQGKQTGCFGKYSCISFNGNKIITGSSGGMFFTNEYEVAEKVRKWSTQSRENASWYQHEEVGYNYRMSNVIAGVVRGQIPYLEQHIEQKKGIYERYKVGLSDLPIQMNPFDMQNSMPNYWLSCILIDTDALCEQIYSDNKVLYISERGKSCPAEILRVLKGINAEGRPIWKPMHMQPMYKHHEFVTRDGSSRFLLKRHLMRQARDIGRDIFFRGLCLPSDNKMSESQQSTIIDTIIACFE